MNLSPNKNNLQILAKILEEFMTFDNIKQAQKSTKSKSNEKQKLIDAFIKNMDEEQKMKFPCPNG